MGEGEPISRPRTSQHRGTFFGLYMPAEAQQHKLALMSQQRDA